MNKKIKNYTELKEVLKGNWEDKGFIVDLEKTKNFTVQLSKNRDKEYFILNIGKLRDSNGRNCPKITDKNTLYNELVKVLTSYGFKSIETQVKNNINGVNTLQLDEEIINKEQTYDRNTLLKKFKGSKILFNELAKEDILSLSDYQLDSLLEDCTSYTNLQLDKKTKNASGYRYRLETLKRIINNIKRERSTNNNINSILENPSKTIKINNIKNDEIKDIMDSKIKQLQEANNSDETIDNYTQLNRLNLLKGFSYISQNKNILQKIDNKVVNKARGGKNFLTQKEQDNFINSIIEDIPFMDSKNVSITLQSILNSINSKKNKQNPDNESYIYKLRTDEYGSTMGNQSFEVNALNEIEPKVLQLRSSTGFGSLVTVDKVRLNRGGASTFGDTIMYYASSDGIKRIIEETFFKYSGHLIKSLESDLEADAIITIDRDEYKICKNSEFLKLVNKSTTKEMYDFIIKKINKTKSQNGRMLNII